MTECQAVMCVTEGPGGGIFPTGLFVRLVARAPGEARPHSEDAVKAPDRGPDDEKVWLTMNSTTVSAELGLRLVVPDRTTVPLLAGLSYTAEDPYAIRMAFHVGNDEPVEWIFARELLTVGIVRRVGDGDVQVWPARSDGERTLNISLTSPFGQALFEVPLAPLTEFLHRTYELVSAGRETDFMDLDEELTNMLWSS